MFTVMKPRGGGKDDADTALKTKSISRPKIGDVFRSLSDKIAEERRREEDSTRDCCGCGC